MAYWTGTLLASPVVRGSSGDTYGTHHSVLGVGGYMEVNTIAERNAIPVDDVNGIGYDGISSGQRRLGMLVYVHEEDTIYKLTVSFETWSGLTGDGQKRTALSNNSNWVTFSSGSDEISGDKIVKDFEQTTHGFVVGDVIGHDGTEFVKSDTTTYTSIEPLGVVSEVIDGDNFKLTFAGYISTSGIVDVDSNSLSGNTIYYLSDTAGKITTTKPTSTTEINKPVLVTLTEDNAIVLQYRGIYDGSTSGGYVENDVFTGYTAETKIILDDTITGATNLGFFTGETGIQTLPINHLSDNSYDGNYRSLYNNYYRDSQGYVRIGIPSDGNPRRGYLHSTSTNKSWIYNEYTGNNNPVGWVFLNVDISSNSVFDTIITGSSNVKYSTPAYTAITWNEGNSYNNGSQIVIDSVIGNLSTGTTYIGGGPVYKDKTDKKLNLRTIKSVTPSRLSIEHNNYFIELSAATNIVNAKNEGGGIGVFSGVSSNNELLFKTLQGGGNTTITQSGDEIIISSISDPSVTTSFENITKKITQESHGFSTKEVVGWSGGTYNKPIADGSYNGEVIGIVKRVINSDNFEVTQAGYISGLTGLINNETYYLSPSVAGAITTTKPTSVGNFVRPIIVANSTTTGWVLPYEGYIIEAPSTGTTTASTEYTGKSPATVSVGGIDIGTVLTGKTLQDIIEEMLVVTIYPDLTNPSNSFSDDASSTYEVGTVIDIDFTANFNRGSIELNSVFQDYRSGYPNTYYYDGDGLPSTVSSSGLTDNQSVTDYTISAGTATWTSCVGYDCGPQPLDSDGNPYSSPLPSGITSSKSTSITGIYPWFWGVEASGGVPVGDNRPTPTGDLVSGGTKVVASSNGTICVNFNSSSDDYIWFAIPSTSTSKTCWYITALNNGDIGGSVSPGGNLFPSFDSVNVSTACWNNISYKLYISNYQSEVTTTMELRN